MPAAKHSETRKFTLGERSYIHPPFPEVGKRRLAETIELNLVANGERDIPTSAARFVMVHGASGF
jgi:hypothetical protein